MEEKTEKPKSKIIRFKRRDEIDAKCWFCENQLRPDYKDIEVIRSFLSPRGKILSRRISRTCASHQRELAREIKIARQVALIR